MLVYCMQNNFQKYNALVGGGSSGAVIANRLSKNNKVLLLEAGGDPLWYNYIPVFSLEMLNRYKYHESRWPRGKVLGGSSSLNYMIYARGHELDFNNWANITGDSSWNYKNVLPYFKKSLIYKGEFSKNEKHYGSTPYGSLQVESRNEVLMSDIVTDAAREYGFKDGDLNGPQKSGIGAIEATLKKGSRCSTFTAFLEPILSRKNLHILRYSHVTKIKLDSLGSARGVFFNRHGKKYYVRASKEVVISAGAVDSPKLLMLSGIGPKEHLSELGIKPKVDLPVGKFLKDHIGVLVGPFLFDKPVTTFPERDLGLSTFLEYFVNGTGHLTFPNLLHMHGFISTSKVKQQHQDWPDIQLYFSYAGIYDNMVQDFSGLTGAKKNTLEQYFSNFIGQHGVSIGVALVRPKSYGDLKLQNKDPATPPLLDPRYLEHPDDIKAFVEGIQFVVGFAEKTKSFQSINSRIPDIYFPGCEKHKLKSDEYWECYARHYAFTIFHPIGYNYY
ncbi:Glucose dehydrogenase [FAD, quinone] [Orchesella cincta]|uniref:Glucose dehydrogenase [FAD, quinone] n=1 Tax=Orchesella cincta TaxID=48709 RepID=A0A1D2NJ31_ORCCI|nr:Glucose dehydrogenase [FAD, quinone] [Orchesella cincta]